MIGDTKRNIRSKKLMEVYENCINQVIMREHDCILDIILPLINQSDFNPSPSGSSIRRLEQDVQHNAISLSSKLSAKQRRSYMTNSLKHSQMICLDNWVRNIDLFVDNTEMPDGPVPMHHWSDQLDRWGAVCLDDGLRFRSLAVENNRSRRARRFRVSDHNSDIHILSITHSSLTGCQSKD